LGAGGLEASALAGSKLKLFEPATQGALFLTSSGLPRKLNLICDHALMAAALAQARASPPSTPHFEKPPALSRIIGGKGVAHNNLPSSATTTSADFLLAPLSALPFRHETRSPQ
jgi:hypothetical protein